MDIGKRDLHHHPVHMDNPDFHKPGAPDLSGEHGLARLKANKALMQDSCP